MEPDAVEEPIFVQRAGGTAGLDLLVSAILLISVIAGAIVAVSGDVGGGVVILVGGPVLTGTVWTWLPRRYEVWAAHLAVCSPFRRWRLPYETVAEARVARWWQPYVFMGVQLVSSPRNAIVLLRRDSHWLLRPNVIISPQDRSTFLPALQDALGRHNGGA